MQPAPPDKSNFLGHPRFSTLNRFREPLEPGKSLVAYQEAINFTRFMGSIASDQKLEVTFAFSNDEVAPNGDWVNDDNLHELNYDAEALKQLYEPTKQAQTGKFFCTIFGRWLRVEVKSVGDAPTTWMRVITRGSVF